MSAGKSSDTRRSVSIMPTAEVSDRLEIHQLKFREKQGVLSKMRRCSKFIVLQLDPSTSSSSSSSSSIHFRA